MQFKSSIFATFTLVVFATTQGVQGGIPASQCNTGPVQCCDSAQSSTTPSVANLLGLLGIAAQGVTGLVGLTCNPITVIGAGGNSCSAQPVCCTNNNFNGVVALGCTPVNLNL